MVEVLEITNCSSPIMNTTLYIVKNVLTIVQIFGPILLIIFASINITKMMMNPEEKKGIKKIINQFLAASILFFVPLLVDVLMNMLGSNYKISACWQEATKPQSKTTYMKTTEKNGQTIIPNPADYEKGKPKPKTSNTSNNSNTSNGSTGETIEGNAKQVGDVVWDSGDVTRISNLTSAQLIKILNSAGGNATNFVPYAQGLITAEQKYHVNVFFLLGIEAIESGWVTSSISRNCNNLGGVCESSQHPSNGCGSNSNCSFAYFPSVNQFIDYHASMLHTNYLTPGGDFYHGKTPSAVVTDYCPGCDDWPSSVISIADELFSHVPNAI